jgi:nucleotide-binding universal stress UspA family protein
MFQTIAVGTDGSETADQAVEMALDLAERLGARLLILSAYRPIGAGRLEREQEEAPEELQWSINPHEDVTATLAEAEQRAALRGLEVTSVANAGEAATVICKLAEEHAADLLVIGNKGMHRRLLGSVPNKISHHAPCSVLIAKTT